MKRSKKLTYCTTKHQSRTTLTCTNLVHVKFPVKEFKIKTEHGFHFNLEFLLAKRETKLRLLPFNTLMFQWPNAGIVWPVVQVGVCSNPAVFIVMREFPNSVQCTSYSVQYSFEFLKLVVSMKLYGMCFVFYTYLGVSHGAIMQYV